MKWIAVAVLWLWLAAVFATHGGVRTWTLPAMMLLVAVAVMLSERWLPATIALAALIALPGVTQAPAISFLAIVIAFAIDDDHPILHGLLVAIVIANRGAFVYAAALVAVARFRRLRDYAVFAVAALVPSIAWLRYVHWKPQISEWVVRPWSDFVHHPLRNALLPFASVHIGLHIETHDILVEIAWPLLLVGLAGLWVLRGEIPGGRRTALVVALVVAFALQQFVLAPFDTENDPARALPVVLAFGVAWCWVVARLWPRRAWRIAFVAVLVVCAAVALSKSPAIAYLSTPQAIVNNPKDAMRLP